MDIRSLISSPAAFTNIHPAERTRLSGHWMLFTRFIWLGIILLNLVLFILAIPVDYAAHFQEAQTSFLPALQRFGLSIQFFALYRTSLETLQALAFTAIAIVIFLVKSDDWMVLLVSLGALSFGALFVPNLVRLVDAYPALWLPVGFLRALGLALSLIVFYYLFPDGSFVPRLAGWLAAIWALMALLWLLFPSLPANLVHLDTWSQNLKLSFAIFLGFYGSGVAAQIYRYRHVSNRLQRQQTKLVVLGTTGGFLGFVLYHVPLMMLPGISQPGEVRLLHILVGVPVYHILILLAPLSIGVAILRYRLWDVDLLINRSLVYGGLTILLVLIYFSSVVGLQQVFHALIHQESSLAVVVSTLAIALLFNPLRGWVQRGIDRGFYRQKYSADQAINAFASTLRDEVDLTRLMERLEGVIWDTVHPAHVLPWLKGQDGYQVQVLGDDMRANGADGDQTAWVAFGDSLVSYLQKAAGVVDLDQLDLDSPGLRWLKSRNVKLMIPLVSQAELVGWISLGKRLSESDYSTYDRYMLASLAVQVAPAVRVAQLAHLQQEQALERERLHHELDVARVIQKTLLPKEPPNLPGWHSDVYYQPARAVGGDMYDFINLTDGRVAIVIGDVSDKGVPAALVMATTRVVLRGAIKRLLSPGAALKRANELLYPEIPPNMFITCFYGLLDPASGELRYANAGHNLPYRRTQGGVQELRATGMPLGMLPGMQYEEFETTIAAGECLLFYSDGLVEAHDPWHDMFGEERLKSLLENTSKPCQNLIERLLSELTNFTGKNWEQEDDVTLVSLQREELGSNTGG
jgi:serine phosphatase RsbU (regulator of sigma subunit)